MPIEVKINGDHALHAASEIRNFCSFMQNSFAVPQPGTQPQPLIQPAIPATPALPAATPGAVLGAAIANAAESVAPKKEPAKKSAVKAAAPVAEGVVTLEMCMKAAQAIGGDGKNDEVNAKLRQVNTVLGIDRVRNLPAEKLDQYMEELTKAFPDGAAPKAAETTDAGSIF